ncbi:MAG: rhomboid family intramembrane serine protease [Eubacteriales bacterium]
MIEKKELQSLNKKKLPIVTSSLIVINCIIFLIMLFTKVNWYAYGASGMLHLIENKEYYRVVTAIFMHGDIEHLFNNMLILYCAGEIVEDSIGKLKFLGVYLFTGIGANLVSCSWEWISGNFFDTVGASGAIFGIVGVLLYLVLFHKGNTRQISKQRMLLMVVFSLYSGFVGENVNNIAHMSGLVLGFLVVYFVYLVNSILINKE